MKYKGYALLLFGIIVALGAAATLELVFAWYIGIALGLIGLVMVFDDKSSENQNSASKDSKENDKTSQS